MVVGKIHEHLQSFLLLGLREWGLKNDTQSGPSSVGVGVRDDLYYCWTLGGHLGYVTVSLPPLSWDRPGWGWLWLASYSWLHWVTHSVPRPVSLSSSEVLQAALVTIKHTTNSAIPSVTVIRSTLYISFYLTFRSFFFLFCSFLCSINKTEPLQRILFLGLHNKRQDCLHNTEISPVLESLSK